MELHHNPSLTARHLRAFSRYCCNYVGFAVDEPMKRLVRVAGILKLDWWHCVDKTFGKARKHTEIKMS